MNQDPALLAKSIALGFGQALNCAAEKNQKALAQAMEIVGDQLIILVKMAQANQSTNAP